MTTAKNTPSHTPTMVRVSALIGLHAHLHKLIEKLGYVGGTAFPVRTTLTRDSVTSLLELMPIYVTSARGGGYQVIGGLRSFMLIKHLLGAEDEVQVLVNEGRVNRDRMLSRFAVEYGLLPILAGERDDKDANRRIGQLKEHLPGALEFGSRDELAAILGISLRTLASRHDKTDV